MSNDAMKPRAYDGPWPYLHRTVAEVMRDPFRLDERAKRADESGARVMPYPRADTAKEVRHETR